MHAELHDHDVSSYRKQELGLYDMHHNGHVAIFILQQQFPSIPKTPPPKNEGPRRSL